MNSRAGIPTRPSASAASPARLRDDLTVVATAVSSGTSSLRVRGDKDPHTTTFAIDETGTRVAADKLAGAIKWLHFDPTLALTLLTRRSGTLGWATRDTGSVQNALWRATAP